MTIADQDSAGQPYLCEEIAVLLPFYGLFKSSQTSNIQFACATHAFQALQYVLHGRLLKPLRSKASPSQALKWSLVQLGSLVGLLQDMGVPRSQLALLKTLLQHAGCEKRVGDLYSNRSFTSRFATMAKHNLRVGPAYFPAT